MIREASLERITKETEIQMNLSLDGKGNSDIETGIGFLIICWRGLPAMVF